MSIKIHGGLNCLMAAAAMFMTVTSVQAAGPDAQFADDGTFLSNRLIVKYKEPQNTVLNSSAIVEQLEAQQQEIKARVDQIAQEVGENLTLMRQLKTGASLIQTDELKNQYELKQLANKMMQDPAVEYAEPDILYHASMVPNDTRYQYQWNLQDTTGGMNMPSAWNLANGQGVVIAVLDTGYLPHADLIANLIIPGYDMIGDTEISADGNGRDSDALDPGSWAQPGVCAQGDNGHNSSWHGTHVSGIAAALANNGMGVAGVAYNARILPVRVLGTCDFGWMSDFADAVIWAAGGNVSGTPENLNPAQVINLSLGGSSPNGCSQTQQQAINQARALGATVVVAAGNANIDARTIEPANCSGVITVAATNADGGKASYSNYGSVIDLSAPGGDSGQGILSTLNGGQRYAEDQPYYEYYMGTSMATPHVSGVAALLYSVKPNITPDEVESILVSTARPFPANCSQCGSGIVDPTAALQVLLGQTQTSPDNVDDDVLSNGISKTDISVNLGEQVFYRVEVPSGVSTLDIYTEGGTGDIDLYVRYGMAPDNDSYDCRPYVYGNQERCSFNSPSSGVYYIMLDGYSRSRNVKLTAQYQ
ncbi:S8 family peptidase [Gynuella sunshinyii]|uniref:Subtilisin-like serine protease n=1 Tax=Gynuella sunshinyii YC6258 TaxID=1445510 RepID=A0A0C5VGQ0_9GAMM|nr:S8 family peptidase [Gynuella sunshinyii]AJQ93747.1 subtilisin-like serine protease [Gynuella sunshinyii YC6258]